MIVEIKRRGMYDPRFLSVGDRRTEHKNRILSKNTIANGIDNETLNMCVDLAHWRLEARMFLQARDTDRHWADMISDYARNNDLIFQDVFDPSNAAR